MNIDYEIADAGIGVLILNRPEKLNAVTAQMKSAIREALDAFFDDKNTRVCVITGRGRSFCSGADRDQLATGELFTGIPGHRLINHSSRRKPLLACVRGDVIGMGLGLALECDLIISSETARFKVGETPLGLPTERYYSLLEYTTNPTFAMDVTVTARFFPAEEALRAHMVSSVWPEDDVYDQTLRLAKLIAAWPERGIAGAITERARRVGAINDAWDKLSLGE